MGCFIWKTVLQILLVYFVVIEGREQDEDTCGDNFVYSDQKVGQNLHMLLTNKSVYQSVFKGTDYTRKNKQFVSVYYLNGTKENQEFVLCIPEKSGRTRTKMIMQRLIDPKYNGTYQYVEEDFYTHINDLNQQDFEKILDDPKIPRIAIVRNPYIRATSMYRFFFGKPSTDWRLNDYRRHIRQIMGFEKEQLVRFDEFVKRLHNFNFKRPQHEKDRHLVPQSASCFIPQGMRYNYILKVQNMDEWWGCFIRKLNIYDEVMHWWPEEDKCFLSTKRDPCNGPFLKKGVVENDNSRAGHNSNSAAFSDKYYMNKTILNLVTQIYLEDFVNFDFQIRI